MKKTCGVFALVVGLGMVSFWYMMLSKGLVPELKTEQVRITYHIFSELLTAAALLTAAFGLLKEKAWGTKVFFIGDAMMVYSVINAAGYYGGLGNKGMLYMFLALLVTGVALGSLLLKVEKQ